MTVSKAKRLRDSMEAARWKSIAFPKQPAPGDLETEVCVGAVEIHGWLMVDSLLSRGGQAFSHEKELYVKKGKLTTRVQRKPCYNDLIVSCNPSNEVMLRFAPSIVVGGVGAPNGTYKKMNYKMECKWEDFHESTRGTSDGSVWMKKTLVNSDLYRRICFVGAGNMYNEELFIGQWKSIRAEMTTSPVVGLVNYCPWLRLTQLRVLSKLYHVGFRDTANEHCKLSLGKCGAQYALSFATCTDAEVMRLMITSKHRFLTHKDFSRNLTSDAAAGSCLFKHWSLDIFHMTRFKPSKGLCEDQGEMSYMRALYAGISVRSAKIGMIGNCSCQKLDCHMCSTGKRGETPLRKGILSVCAQNMAEHLLELHKAQMPNNPCIVYKITKGKAVRTNGQDDMRLRCMDSLMQKAVEKEDVHGNVILWNLDHEPWMTSNCKLPILTYSKANYEKAEVIPDWTFAHLPLKTRNGNFETINRDWEETKKEVLSFRGRERSVKYFRGAETNEIRKRFSEMAKGDRRIEVHMTEGKEHRPLSDICGKTVLLDFPGRANWSNRFKYLFLTGALVVSIRVVFITKNGSREETFSYADKYLTEGKDYIAVRMELIEGEDEKNEVSTMQCFNKVMCIKENDMLMSIHGRKSARSITNEKVHSDIFNSITKCFVSDQDAELLKTIWPGDQNRKETANKWQKNVPGPSVRDVASNKRETEPLTPALNCNTKWSIASSSDVADAGSDSDDSSRNMPEAGQEVSDKDKRESAQKKEEEGESSQMGRSRNRTGVKEPSSDEDREVLHDYLDNFWTMSPRSVCRAVKGRLWILVFDNMGRSGILKLYQILNSHVSESDEPDEEVRSMCEVLRWALSLKNSVVFRKNIAECKFTSWEETKRQLFDRGRKTFEMELNTETDETEELLNQKYKKAVDHRDAFSLKAKTGRVVECGVVLDKSTISSKMRSKDRKVIKCSQDLANYKSQKSN